MTKLFSLIILIMFGSFSCTASYDNETIAKIGRQKISKVLFHKQIPEVRFNSLSDSLKVEKVEEFLKDLLIERDIQKLELENNSEIVKEMNLWSKRTLSGLMFDKKILNKLFPGDSLKNIYNNFKKLRNVSVIVIPYIKTRTDKIPDKNMASKIADDIYNRSKIENFEDLQLLFSKVGGFRDESKSYWAQLFAGIQSVDRELWKYQVGQITKPIDDGQAFRIIKINSEKENKEVPEYEFYKDELIKQVVTLWKKPLQEYFLFHTDSLLKDAQYFIDPNKVNIFSRKLNAIIKGNNILDALKELEYDEKIGRYRDSFIDKEWFLKELQKQENIFAHQLADINKANGFIKGFISSKVNYDTAIKMGLQNSPLYIDKYKNELNIRLKNFYDLNIFLKGLKLSEAEMVEYYDKNRKDFSVPPKIYAKSIWFNNYDIAMNQFKKIKKLSYSFDELFSSMDSKRNKNGGTMKNFISPTSKNDPYNVLFKLENGSISDLMSRGNKYYIIKVIEKIGPQLRSFEEVKSQIYMRLTKKNKIKNYKIATDRLLKKFNVRINENLISS